MFHSRYRFAILFPDVRILIKFLPKRRIKYLSPDPARREPAEERHGSDGYYTAKSWENLQAFHSVPQEI